MKKIHFSLVLPIILGCQQVLANEVMEERKRKAQQNIEEQKRADEAIQEEQIGKDPDFENPYEYIDPKSKKNMFEEMQSNQYRNPNPAL